MNNNTSLKRLSSAARPQATPPGPGGKGADTGGGAKRVPVSNLTASTCKIQYVCDSSDRLTPPDPRQTNVRGM